MQQVLNHVPTTVKIHSEDEILNTLPDIFSNGTVEYANQMI